MDYESNFKDFLKDKSSENNLAQKEMLELQAAIDKSKETAKDEEEQREFDQQTVDIKRFYKNSSSSSEGTSKESSLTPKQQKTPAQVSTSEVQRSTKITIQDIPEISGKFLKIIYHEPIFELPIPLNPRFKKYSVEQRARLLSDSYTRIDKLRAKLARQSILRAPYPKPIQASNKGGSSPSDGIDGDLFPDDIINQIPVQDLYVSRSGRQVKRKIYTEDTLFDIDSDFALSVKKNRSDINDSDMKIILDTPYAPEEEKNDKKPVKNKKEPPKKSFSTRMTNSRAEKLFDKMVQNEEKKKQQQEELTHFKDTLPDLEDSEEFFIDSSSPVKETQVADDENFVRRVVTPPLPTKRIGRSRKTTKQEDLDKIEVLPEETPGSPVLKHSTYVPKPKARTPIGKKQSPEKKSISKVEKIGCPICSKEFLQTEIEHHASTCGIEDEIVEDVARNDRGPNLKCELCERVFHANTDYEVHVKQCIALKINDM